jgi:hypothetical protein
MSKRKREIKKRKKLLEEAQANESPLAAEPIEDVAIQEDTAPEDLGPEAVEPEELLPPESPIDDSQIVTTPAPPPVRRPVPKKETSDRLPKATAATDSWLGKNKENFLLGLLILYVLLLGLGTVGELFEIEWILNLPLFR